MSTFRRCCRPGCGRPAIATLVYAYSEKTAIVGPLAPSSDPHAWDLCQRHSEHITAPVGWEMVRIDNIELSDEEEITALAQAVSEAGRVTTGLVDTTQDPIEFDAERDYTNPDTSNHPVYRTKRVGEHLAEHKAARRAHLTVVPDPDADPNADRGAGEDVEQD